MAAMKSMWLRLSSSVLQLRMAIWCPDTFNVGGYLLATRGFHNSPANLQRRKIKREKPPEFVNSAALEPGVTKYFCNHNPRSLELLGIAEKPRGFATKKTRVDFYHRLMFEVSSRHARACVDHNNGAKVVEASTTEFCISRHLYKTSDVAAAYNVGRVIASRCRETGLYRVMWEHKRDRHRKKVKAFLRGVAEGGLLLNEPKVRRQLPEPGTLPR